ncbi:RING finger protein 39-like [Myiozetetes cayanensis]|uniref:RING finger protein 39-like n=1 Tax=Myiozetetes cayanensis TaxID=478635 RepID=UPI00215F6F07|nr:RING finger protein 39-like [Myiozetetes cayanensis]
MAQLPPEASCPICLELFQDPVSIHCGHHFCRGCITRCWEWATQAFPCPRCREPAPELSLRPGRELARVLGIARSLGLGAAPGRGQQGQQGEEEEEEEEEEGCQKHQEPLRVFCEEDRALLCGVCRESRAHRAHTLLALPEAQTRFQTQLQARLQTLRDARDKLLEFREAEMRRNWEFLEKTESERQRVLSHLQGLRLSLEEHAQALLARLGDLERDLEKRQEENLTSLTQEISRLDTRIQELQDKCQEPARTFLRDIGSTLSRLQNEHFQLPPSPLPELEKRISHFRERNDVLEETLRSFQDVLMFELPEKMLVTLDPHTAHPQLVVAPDGGSVRWEPTGEPSEPQDPFDPSDSPEPSVLGLPGVCAGRCCWDVEVSPEGSWALGVAGEGTGSGTPPGQSPPCARGSLWALGQCQGRLWALAGPERVPLARVRVPRRVRVSLDRDRGRVAFFDADSRALIFAFPSISFGGRGVRPWFLLWGEGARLALCP